MCLLTRKPNSKRFPLAAAYVLPQGYSYLTWQNLKGCSNPSLKSFCTHCENLASRAEYVALKELYSNRL